MSREARRQDFDSITENGSPEGKLAAIDNAYQQFLAGTYTQKFPNHFQQTFDSAEGLVRVQPNSIDGAHPNLQEEALNNQPLSL